MYIDIDIGKGVGVGTVIDIGTDRDIEDGFMSSFVGMSSYIASYLV